MLIFSFLYVLTANNQKEAKPNPPPPQREPAGKPEIKLPAPQPAVIGPSQIMLPLTVAGNTMTTAVPKLTTVAPQPVIVNNQVLLML